MGLKNLNKTTVIYISGPMTGLPGFNYEEFRKAEQFLRSLGFDNIQNPIDTDTDVTDDSVSEPGSKSWDWYMRAAITKLMKSEVLYMLEGWERSKGAVLEFKIGCIELGMPVYYQRFFGEL